MMAIILLILSLLYPQDASENVRRDGAGKENVWDWKGNGVTVLVKYIEIDSKKYLHYEMHQGQEQTVLAHAELRHSSAPTHVKFCAKDQTSFAIFFYDDLTGGVALQEYSIAEKKRKGRKGTQLITAKQKSKGNKAPNNELRQTMSCVRIAVGTAVSSRPPHRSVLDELRHTAPALSRARKRWLG
jgi:hypothetical protein